MAEARAPSPASPEATRKPAAEAPRRPLIELGWVLVGRLPPPDRKAVEQARERVLETLGADFPGFEWRMPVVERETPPGPSPQMEIVDLLDQGVVERQAKGWDFALVITGSELESFYKPFALGAPSRSLSVAVASTVRIDPRASGRGTAVRVGTGQRRTPSGSRRRESPAAARGDTAPGNPALGDVDRTEVMTTRLHALVLHLFGHLNELGHHEDPESYMYDLAAVMDLDRMRRFSAEAVEYLGGELEEVADVRLEEERSAYRSGRAAFYLRALWHNRDDIADAVRRARPWQFPLRFSRLTAAAFSALLILLITAEAWDLGMSQRPPFVTGLSVVTLVGASVYLLRRQGLLVRREVARLTELTVVSNVSTVISVALGLLTTYAMLFGTTLLLGRTLYRPRLVAAWADSLGGEVTWVHYLVLAAFVASLGLLIGALGASFEGQSYFRHVAWVDEET